MPFLELRRLMGPTGKLRWPLSSIISHGVTAVSIPGATHHCSCSRNPRQSCASPIPIIGRMLPTFHKMSICHLCEALVTVHTARGLEPDRLSGLGKVLQFNGKTLTCIIFLRK